MDTTFPDEYLHDFHFIDEETEAESWEVTCQVCATWHRHQGAGWTQSLGGRTGVDTDTGESGMDTDTQGTHLPQGTS